jgi:predicted nucleotidyltransferase
MLKNILTNKSADKVLRFLTLNRDDSFYDKEVSEHTGLSRGVTNQTLNLFMKAGIVQRERRGRMWFYTLTKSPLIKSYRIYDNLVALNETVNKLKQVAQRIILFGSAANGSDTAESDIDLFIVSTNKKEVMRIIGELDTDREIKPVALTPVEYAVSRSKDKSFYAQVENGLKLFEEDVDEQRL